MVSSGSLGALGTGASRYSEAVQLGKSEEDAWKSYFVGLGIGSLEAMPVGLNRAAMRLAKANRASGGALKNITVGQVMLAEGLEEAGQEMLSEGLNQLSDYALSIKSAEEAFDLNQLLESGVLGFLPGSAIGGITAKSQIAASLAEARKEAETAEEAKVAEELKAQRGQLLAEQIGAVETQAKQAQELVAAGEAELARLEGRAPTTEAAPAAETSEAATATGTTPATAAETPAIKLETINYENLKEWDETTKSTTSSNGSVDIIDLADRQVVVVNVNGVKVPFYRSTGAGGKKGVAVGKWYPVFGVGQDLWFNKGTEAQINDYYGSQALKNAALQLDAALGTAATGKKVSLSSVQKSLHSGLADIGLTPTENDTSQTLKNLDFNIAAVISAIDASAAVSPVVSSAATPAAAPTAVPTGTPEEIATVKGQLALLRQNRDALAAQLKAITEETTDEGKALLAGAYGEAQARAEAKGLGEQFRTAVTPNAARLLTDEEQAEWDEKKQKLGKREIFKKDYDGLKNSRLVVAANEAQQKAEKVLTDLGFKVEFLDPGNDNKSFKGLEDGTTVYLNARLSDEALLRRVARHEAFHGVFRSKDGQDLWKDTMQRLQQAAPNVWAAAQRKALGELATTTGSKEKLKALLSTPEGREQLLNEQGSSAVDIFSATMDALEANPELADEAMQADPTFFQKLYDWVKTKLNKLGFKFETLADADRRAIEKLPKLLYDTERGDVEVEASANERIAGAQVLLRLLAAAEAGTVAAASGRERQARMFASRTLGELEATRTKEELAKRLEEEQAARETAAYEDRRKKAVDAARARLGRIKTADEEWKVIEAIGRASTPAKQREALATLPGLPTDLRPEEVASYVQAATERFDANEAKKADEEAKRVAALEKQRKKETDAARKLATAQREQEKRKEEKYYAKLKELASDTPTGSAAGVVNRIAATDGDQAVAEDAVRSFLGKEATDDEVIVAAQTARETAIRRAARLAEEKQRKAKEAQDAKDAQARQAAEREAKRAQERKDRLEAQAARAQAKADERQRKLDEKSAARQRREDEARAAEVRAQEEAEQQAALDAAEAERLATEQAEQETQDAADRQRRRREKLPTVARGRFVPGQLRVGDIVNFNNRASKVVDASGSGFDQRIKVVPITNEEAALADVVEERGTKDWWNAIPWMGEPVAIDMTDKRLLSVIAKRSDTEVMTQDGKKALRKRYEADLARKEGDAPLFSVKGQAITPEMEAEYMAAAEAGNLATAQRMVDEAARMAGYDTTIMYHGSKEPQTWMEFKKNDSAVASGAFMFTPDPDYPYIRNNPNVRKFYLRLKNPIRAPFEWAEGIAYQPAEVAKDMAAGHDGLIYEGDKRFYKSESRYYTQVAIYSPKQAKLADPVTYDDNGNIIPLSQRFNEQVDDIRFSVKGQAITPEMEAEYMAAAEAGDLATAQQMVDQAAVTSGMMFRGHKRNRPLGLTETFVAKSREQAQKFANQFSDGVVSLVQFTKPLRVYDAKEPIPWQEYQDSWKNSVLLKGYDAVRVEEPIGQDESLAVRNQTAIEFKSADPITYDDNGNIIPLSQRFQDTTDDIRFSVRAKVPAAVGFAGGGTFEIALSDVLDTQLAVEMQPDIAEAYNRNAQRPATVAKIGDVNAEDFKGKVLAHFSPPCVDSSLLRSGQSVNKAEETERGREVANIIRVAQNPIVVIENVREYGKSEAYKLITDALTESGYTWDAHVYKAQDYGSPSKRQRLFVRAVKQGELPPRPEPTHSNKPTLFEAPYASWGDALADVIDTLPEFKGELPPYVLKALKSANIDPKAPSKAYYISGTQVHGLAPLSPFDKPSPGMVASGAETPRILMPDGRVLRVTPEAMKRLMGFGAEMQLPSDPKLAKRIVGNGIPKPLTRAVVLPLLESQGVLDTQGPMFSAKGKGGEKPGKPSKPKRVSAKAAKSAKAALKEAQQRAAAAKLKRAKDALRKEVKPLTEQALKEGEGTSVGEAPGSAIAATTEEARALTRGVREYMRQIEYQILPTLKADDDARAFALAELENNYEGTKEALFEEIRNNGSVSEPWKQYAVMAIAAQEAESATTGRMTTDKFYAAYEAESYDAAIRRNASAQLRVRKDAVMAARKRNKAHVFAGTSSLRKAERALNKALEGGNKADVTKARKEVEKIRRDHAQAVVEYLDKKREEGYDVDDMFSYLAKGDLVTFSRLMRGLHGARTEADLRAGRVKSVWDAFIEARHASMLSGPGTHIANIAGNAAMMTLRTTRQLAEVLTNLVIRDRDSADFGDFKAYMTGWLRSLGRAMRNFVMAYRTDMPVFEAQLNADSTLEFAEQANAIPGLIGRILRFPSLTTLRAFDELFKTMAAHTEAGSLAYRQGRRDGLSGAGLESFIDYVLTDYNHPLWQEGLERARTTVFQARSDELTRVLLQARNWLDNNPTTVPIGSFLLPYIKTPTQIIKVGLSMPIHPFVPMFKFAKQALGAGTYEKSERVPDAANAMVAVGMLVLAYSLLGDDDDDQPALTGAAPADYRERQLAERTAPPNSIRVGDTWYSYNRVEPFATSMSALADMVKATQIALNEDVPERYNKALATLMNNAVGQLEDKTFLRTLGDVSKMFRDRENVNAAKMTRDLFISPMMPNLVRQLASAGDPYMRDVSVREYEDASEWDAMYQKLTYQVYPSKDNPDAPPIKHDLWGRPVERQGGSYMARAFSPAKQTLETEDINKLDRLIVRFNDKVEEGTFGGAVDKYLPRAPEYRIRRGDQEFLLSDDEYSRLTRDAGQLAQKRLQYRRLNYEDPTERDIEIIRDALSKARKTTIDRILRDRRMQPTQTGN
jgi:site-specific DNA-cytosine methylase